jgi:hypothetical protein
MTRQDLRRFTSKFRKTKTCWIWMHALEGSGYGQIYWEGKVHRVHRLAWELANGPIPDGLFVCHSCDNRRCVNPAHLFLGTNRDNINDSIAKNRFLRNRKYGEDHSRAKLSNADVAVIRASGDGRKGGIPAYILAEQFSVYAGTINKIRQHRHRKHAP